MAVTVGSSGGIRVVVYDSRIQAMSAPGGDVFRYAQHKAQRTAALAKVYAPKRTGRLAGSIRSDTRTVVQGAVGRARATMYYAGWVHEGTDRVEGKRMWMPKRKGGTLRHWRTEREGQDANPFLARALSSSMAEPYFMRGARLTTNPF